MKNNFPKGSDTLLETLRTGAPDAFEQLYVNHREDFFSWAGRRFETGYVNLYDLHGRRLMRMPLQSADTPYQLKSLPAGVYVIEVMVPGAPAEYLRWVGQ